MRASLRVRLLADPARLAARAARRVDLRLHARPRAHLAPAPSRAHASPGRPRPSTAPGPSADRHRRAPRSARSSPCCGRSRSRCSLLGARWSSSAALLHRRARARATTRWELRLGRDDLANPYRVQEAFEGIAGAICARWYERLWRGPDHFALEIHRLPDLSIRFTIAAPARARARDPRAARGPLPRRRADRGRRPARPGRGCVVRLKKRRPFVLSIQTTRNYEHAFSESLVALLGTRRARADRPARPHAGARLRASPRAAAAQAPRARAAARRPPRPRRARHRLRRRGQGAQGRARDSSTARSLYFDLRVTGRRPDGGAARRRPVLAAALRERARAPRDARCAARSTRARIALRAAEPAARAGGPACSRRRSWRRCGSSRARASSTRGCRARRSGARSRRRRSTATPTRMLLRDERGPVSIAPARPQVRPRADRRPGRRQELGHGPPLRQRRPRPRPRRHPHRPQGPARRALPRPRARRAHRPLPRPRPPRDRHQPARRSTPAPAPAPPSSCRR